jgi:mannose-6-phosphate isomerase-like protein (cupin superfamily)
MISREVVIIPDVAVVPWRAMPAPGIYSKTLSIDAATGARSALLRMNPNEGYLPPSMAHYHDTYEEILAVTGRLTFDKKVWLGRGGYIYHPAGTVHGFASVVPEDTVILSRIGPHHVGNLVPEPAHDDMYSVYGTPALRAPESLSEPMAGTLPISRPFLGDGIVRWHEISTAESGAHGAAMVVFPAGWRSLPQASENTFEIFTLTPSLVFEGVPSVESPDASFVRIPRGATVPQIDCASDVLAFVTFGEIEDTEIT